MNNLKDLDFNTIYRVSSFFQPSDGDATFEYLERDNRKIYKITKYHGSKKALDFIHEKVRPESEKDPHNWLYLADGYTDEISLMLPETTYAFSVAKKLSIPVEDPVVSPYSKECVDFVIFSTGIREFDMHLAVIIDMFPYQKENTLDFINRICGINMSQDYFNGCATYLNELDKKGDLESTKELSKILSEKLYISSRDFSKKRVKDLLAKHNKEKIMLLTGYGHKDII